MKPLADLLPLVEQVRASNGAFVDGIRGFVDRAYLSGENYATLAAGLSSADEVLRREPTDWEALDKLQADARYSTTTMGILLALGASWVRGGDASQAVSRLVAALTHQHSPVRDQAHAILQQAAVDGLAATYQEIISGTPAVSCSTCRYLSDETSWGDLKEPTTPEPPQFKQLTRLSEKEYRCPQCGTYYALAEETVDNPNSNGGWTQWTLTRMGGAEKSTAVQTHELLRTRDFAGLARTLHSSEVWKTLETQVAEGLDIAPLVPALRGLLAGSENAEVAAKILTRYWARHGDAAEVEALLGDGRPEVQLGALRGLDYEALADPAGAARYLSRVRLFLGSDEGNVRRCASAILLKAGLKGKATARATVADATRRLDSPRPEERELAAGILSEAARQGAADIGPALPRLAELARGADAARYSASNAITHAGAEWENYGGAAGLAERLRQGNDESRPPFMMHPCDSEVRSLLAVQERGEDVSGVFEALATMSGSWHGAKQVLTRAAIQGDDLTTAVPGLRRQIEKADQNPGHVSGESFARGAVGILACHFLHRRSFTDLAALLKADHVRHRGGAYEIALELVGLVWGKEPAKGDRRRKAAVALTCLSLWGDRPDFVSTAFKLDLPDGVMAGVLEGLLAAAKSGLNVERFLGRVQKLDKQPLVAEIVATVKPEPLQPVDRTEWHSGPDSCQVTDTEVLCSWCPGPSETAKCTLDEFLEGKRQGAVLSIFGEAVFREVLNAVKSKIHAAWEKKAGPYDRAEVRGGGIRWYHEHPFDPSVRSGADQSFEALVRDGPMSLNIPSEVLAELRALAKRLEPVVGPILEERRAAEQALRRGAAQGDDLTAAVPGLKRRIEMADQNPADPLAEGEAGAAVGILACHFLHRQSFNHLAALLKADQARHRLGQRGAGGIIPELEDLVFGFQIAQGDRRRKAAAALVCLSLWADRFELASLAVNRELPDDMKAGVLEGLLAAAKSGLDVERFLARVKKITNQPLVAEILATVKPEPLQPVDRTEWHSGRDSRCQVTDTEVVFSSPPSEVRCTLDQFLEGSVQDVVQAVFGSAVFREVLNAVKAKRQIARPSRE